MVALRNAAPRAAVCEQMRRVSINLEIHLEVRAYYRATNRRRRARTRPGGQRRRELIKQMSQQISLRIMGLPFELHTAKEPLLVDKHPRM